MTTNKDQMRSFYYVINPNFVFSAFRAFVMKMVFSIPQSIIFLKNGKDIYAIT